MFSGLTILIAGRPPGLESKPWIARSKCVLERQTNGEIMVKLLLTIAYNLSVHYNTIQ